MNSIKKTISVLVILIANQIFAQNKAQQLAFIQSYDNESKVKYDAAIADINSVYAANAYESNLRLGWLHYKAGKYKESVSFYQKAAAIMPAATEPKWAVLNPLKELENWSEIEATYISILKLDAKNTLANYNLGSIYYYRKNYITAKKYFDVSLNLYPFDYNNLLMSAWTNYFLGNKNEAIILFNKTLLYSPNDKSALEGLSLIK